jgi:hypothetical protein
MKRPGIREDHHHVQEKAWKPRKVQRIPQLYRATASQTMLNKMFSLCVPRSLRASVKRLRHGVMMCDAIVLFLISACHMCPYMQEHSMRTFIANLPSLDSSVGNLLGFCMFLWLEVETVALLCIFSLASNMSWVLSSRTLRLLQLLRPSKIEAICVDLWPTH